jgi:hypothetical protein
MGFFMGFNGVNGLKTFGLQTGKDFLKINLALSDGKMVVGLAAIVRMVTSETIKPQQLLTIRL